MNWPVLRGTRVPAALGNVALRIGSQVLRFVLSFYVVGFLGLHAAGLYGLALGAIGIVPALIGWGLNYHLSRELAGRTPTEAAPLVRDRIAISLGSLASVSLLTIPLIALATPAADWSLYVLVLVLIWLETISLDIFVALLAVEKSLFANLLVFIRSALWVVPVVGLGLVEPRLRTLELLLEAWIGFHLLALAIFAAKLPKWRVMEALSAPIDVAWAGQWLRTRWFIYLSDLGYVGLIYLDRYLVLLLLGLTATAVYTFYWALANALQTIVLAGMVQAGRPRLILAAGRGDRAGWRAEIFRQLRSTFFVALALAVLNLGITDAIIQLMPQGKLPTNHMLFALLLAAAVLRSCSDVLNSGLIGQNRDAAYAAVNLLGIATTLVVAPLAMLAWGLQGAGIALVLVSGALVALRAALLVVAHRRSETWSPK